MNWDDAKIFLALHREGSLRGAARVVGVDQTTIGRRIAALEHRLAATLFLRTSKGYVLTHVGEIVLASAQQMELAAIDFVRAAQGVDNRLVGEVGVATTDTLGMDFLIPALTELHQRYPDIRVILNTSTQVVNLSLREADIAIRTVKPDNPDLIIRKLASWPVGLYASADYLARHGIPEAGTGFAGHSLVVYEPHWQSARSPMMLEEAAEGATVAAGVNTSLMLPDAASGPVDGVGAWRGGGSACRASRVGAGLARAAIRAILRCVVGDPSGCAACRAGQGGHGCHRQGICRDGLSLAGILFRFCRSVVTPLAIVMAVEGKPSFTWSLTVNTVRPSPPLLELDP
ncbi:LysR family transcriptional regulator [Aeromonas veronii]